MIASQCTVRRRRRHHISRMDRVTIKFVSAGLMRTLSAITDEAYATTQFVPWNMLPNEPSAPLKGSVGWW